MRACCRTCKNNLTPSRCTCLTQDLRNVFHISHLDYLSVFLDGANYNVALACHQHYYLESIIANTRTLDKLSFGIDVQIRFCWHVTDQPWTGIPRNAWATKRSNDWSAQSYAELQSKCLARLLSAECYMESWSTFKDIDVQPFSSNY